MKPVDPDTVFSINNPASFLETALEIFRYQSEKTRVYREYINMPGIYSEGTDSLSSIPFLPVGFFRNFRIITNEKPHELVFESSGTTYDRTSRHYIASAGLYRRSFRDCFRLFYGEPSEYIITALLPSYLERNNSSLVFMMSDLIGQTTNPFSGFFKDNNEKLTDTIEKAGKTGKKIILIGVSFALLDLAESLSPDLHDVIVMETGGMKGRRKELTRTELHSVLCQKLNINSVHSEYGMTELLSQAYSKGNGRFHCPPWMKILIRDPHDPLEVTDEPGITGGINVIDLANIYSCSFVATDDLGRLNEDGSFEVLGRFDNSDIRGCNLLIS